MEKCLFCKTEARYKYLGVMITDQNYFHKQIKSRLNSGMFATSQLRMFCLNILYLKMYY
jgi:hypothetical protein